MYYTCTYLLLSLLVWYLSIFLAFQHYLTMIGAIVSIPFILTPALCMSDEDPNRGIIISTMIFVTGIVTYFQATWGVRLPIVQGGTISFLVPTLAILALPQWKCPPQAELDAMNAEDREELWQIRMRELSGAIAVSAMVQVVLGYTGLVGKILKYVSANCLPGGTNAVRARRRYGLQALGHCSGVRQRGIDSTYS